MIPLPELLQTVFRMIEAVAVHQHILTAWDKRYVVGKLHSLAGADYRPVLFQETGTETEASDGAASRQRGSVPVALRRVDHHYPRHADHYGSRSGCSAISRVS